MRNRAIPAWYQTGALCVLAELRMTIHGYGLATVSLSPKSARRWPAQARRWLGASATRRWVTAIFAIGIFLRATVMLLYSTVVLVYYGGDSTRYARLPVSGYRSLFSDPNSPAGYPFFLEVVRALDKSVVFTVGIQHVMGVATAALLLVLVRRAGAPLWAALVPAAVVLFSGDFIFLETALLTETLWMLLIAGGLCAAVYARGSLNSSRWLVLAGVLLALAALVRSLALPLVIPVTAWAAWELGAQWKRRLMVTAAVLIPFALLVAGYTAVASQSGGFAGLTEMGGFNLYARVGQFANCQDFTPPKGTAGLCEATPSNERDGPFYYSFGGPSAPMYRAGFEANPADSSLLGKFADAAIENQPGEYLRAVIKDLSRYIATEALVVRPDSGTGPAEMSFASKNPANQGQTPALLAHEMSADYSDVSSAPPGQGTRELLGAYQEIFRLSGLPTIILLALAIVGIGASRGPERRTVLLFLCIAAYLYVIPVAISSYDVRYGVPAGMVLSVAGALGAWALTKRIRWQKPQRADQVIGPIR